MLAYPLPHPCCAPAPLRVCCCAPARAAAGSGSRLLKPKGVEGAGMAAAQLDQWGRELVSGSAPHTRARAGPRAHPPPPQPPPPPFEEEPAGARAAKAKKKRRKRKDETTNGVGAALPAPGTLWEHERPEHRGFAAFWARAGPGRRRALARLHPVWAE